MVRATLLAPFSLYIRMSIKQHRKTKRLNSLYYILFVRIAVDYSASGCKVYLYTVNTCHIHNCGFNIALAVVAIHSFYRKFQRCGAARLATACTILLFAIAL